MKIGDLVYCPIDLESGEMWPKAGVKALGLVVNIESLASSRAVERDTIIVVSYPAWTGSNFFDSWQLRHVDLINES